MTKAEILRNFDLEEVSKFIETQVPQKSEKIIWKFEGSRLTVEDGEFDYDLAALSVDEQLDEEQNHFLHVIPVKQT